MKQIDNQAESEGDEIEIDGKDLLIRLNWMCRGEGVARSYSEIRVFLQLDCYYYFYYYYFLSSSSIISYHVRYHHHHHITLSTLDFFPYFFFLPISVNDTRNQNYNSILFITMGHTVRIFYLPSFPCYQACFPYKK